MGRAQSCGSLDGLFVRLYSGGVNLRPDAAAFGCAREPLGVAARRSARVRQPANQPLVPSTPMPMVTRPTPLPPARPAQCPRPRAPLHSAAVRRPPRMGREWGADAGPERRCRPPPTPTLHGKGAEAAHGARAPGMPRLQPPCGDQHKAMHAPHPRPPQHCARPPPLRLLPESTRTRITVGVCRRARMRPRGGHVRQHGAAAHASADSSAVICCSLTIWRLSTSASPSARDSAALSLTMTCSAPLAASTSM